MPGFNFHGLQGVPKRYSIHVNGPWCITFGDTEATAQRIVEALPNAVVIQTQAEDGTNQTIRIPYAKITGCKAVA